MKGETPAYGIVIAGHGSRDPDGIREFEALVALARMQAPGHRLSHGYLEFARPTLAEAVAAQVAAGVTQLVVVPGVLLAARHAKNDLPVEVLTLARDYPEIAFHFGAPLDIHPRLLDLAQERICAAEASAPHLTRRAETCLVVVGRGTTDPEANGEVAKLARMLEEGMGFGGSWVCYSGTARPLVTEGLRRAARLGFARLIVLPFFLFDGVLVKRIYAAAADLRKREPALEVLDAGTLGVHAAVVEVMLARAAEAIAGRAAMNCTLCKYRVQIVGFEEQVGEVLRAHHLAVRGAVPPAEVLALGARPAYVPHPIEAESMAIIAAGRDWSAFPAAQRQVLQRLAHTSGDFAVAEGIYFSPGAVEIGIRALLRCKLVVTDETMVQTGLKRALLADLGIDTWCGVHDRETAIVAAENHMTRSAAGIRRAFERFGNDLVLAIGDAPTAIFETVRLIQEQGWRPQLVVGLPVGFVGTEASKEALRRCLQVPRITNFGTRGGSPWAASVVNAMLIDAVEQRVGDGSDRT